MVFQKSILIVDDEPQIRRVMKVTLASLGYLVSDVRSGEEALKAVHEEKPDLILLDVNMPGMSGMETCRALRESHDVAIIMLSVRDTERDKVEALDAGADDYVTKPFSMSELLARIRASLRRSPPAKDGAASLFAFGNVVVNLSTHRVTVGGKEVRFTPKEFALLQALLSQANVAIPHARLLQAVWGPEYSGEVGYLHVFINQIRKKIEPVPAAPRYILTEPWLGYRFAAPVE